MKKFTFSLALGLFLFSATTVLAQVSINNDGTAPHASAMLEVKSTAKGFLLPRLTTAQRTTLGASATAGLSVYDTDLKKIFTYNGTTWDEGGIGNFWQKNGSNVFLTNSSDFVGIGLTNPAKPLEVKGSWQTVRFSSTSSGAGLELVGASSPNWSINTWAGSLYLISSTDQFASKTDQYFITTSEMSPANGTSHSLGSTSRTWDNLFSVDGSFTGSLGVGTTAPLAKLHVHDAVNKLAKVIITPEAPSIEDSAMVFLSEGASAQTGMYWLYDGVGNQMELWAKAFGSDVGPHMLVNRDNGNIAMGGTTFATGYKLSVAGKIICTELRVNQVADWPDYVFNKDYNLMPVHKLATFISENGHLPNIPKASEVAKSGIEMGEMQRRMMEKIEELSLYIINQQKQIDDLKAQLENQQ